MQFAFIAIYYHSNVIDTYTQKRKIIYSRKKLIMISACGVKQIKVSDDFKFRQSLCVVF